MSLFNWTAKASLLFLFLAGCNRHTLQDGSYHLTRTANSAVNDPCGLLGAGDDLGLGSMAVHGNEIRFDFTMNGLQQPIALIGRFKNAAHGELDQFLIDGSIANTQVTIGNLPCAVRFGQLEIDATITDSGTQWEGSLTVHHAFELNQDPGCPERCNMSVSYLAVRAP